MPRLTEVQRDTQTNSLTIDCRDGADDESEGQGMLLLAHCFTRVAEEHLRDSDLEMPT